MPDPKTEEEARKAAEAHAALITALVDKGGGKK